MPPSPISVSHTELRARLFAAGSSLYRIARDLGVTNTAVIQAAKWTPGRAGRSRRIEAAIAAKLGTSAAALWPERYPPHLPANRAALPRKVA